MNRRLTWEAILCVMAILAAMTGFISLMAYLTRGLANA